MTIAGFFRSPQKRTASAPGGCCRSSAEQESPVKKNPLPPGSNEAAGEKYDGRDDDPILRRIRERGLNVTRQREVLARIFRDEDHVTVEELYSRAVQEDPGIGRVTVYRFLKILCRLNLARERHFEESDSKFDNIVSKKHHDHMICEECGRIIEFTCDEIEHLQEKISRSRGFLIRGHRLEIRGLCRECRSASRIGSEDDRTSSNRTSQPEKLSCAPSPEP